MRPRKVWVGSIAWGVVMLILAAGWFLIAGNEYRRETDEEDRRRNAELDERFKMSCDLDELKRESQEFNRDGERLLKVQADVEELKKKAAQEII